MNSIDVLVNYLSRIPGLGQKSARRIAYWLVKADVSFVRELGNLISSLPDKIKKCRICGMLSETQVCEFCADATRNSSLICVVEQPSDVFAIEATRSYRGLYHVLNGVISPLEGVGPDDISIAELIERIKKATVKEIIIATNPTVEGDTTALYISRLIEPLGIKVSRLALGLPVGGDLEYADRTTLARALEGRQSLN
ncbi:recombination mediator RecR [Spirochaetia bacterium 38H-sp]|uniref:Recombination protein RecR n=1 Tax=Rarispira pelagica TaxID=3141764 RepID=A0ABU9UAI6_9SPIR